jgi:uncharacterized protein with PIN domain
MTETLTVCAYCERTIPEILDSGATNDPDMALRFVMVGENRTKLCPDCTSKYAPPGADDLHKLLEGPITFPPGVTAVEHCCPELEFRGMDEDDATFVIEMARKGEYYVGSCPHCNVVIRSLSEDEEL